MSDFTRASVAGAVQDASGGAAEAVRVQVGLDRFEVVAAQERGDGGLEVQVR